MSLDLNALKQHYSILSDNALLAIERADLVDAARQLYDAEIESRGLAEELAELEPAPDSEEQVDEALSETHALTGWESEPVVVGRFQFASEVKVAVDKLEAAGVPNHLERADPKEDPQQRFQLQVPATLAEQARSILYDKETTEDYVAHFDELTDEELHAVDISAIPKVARQALKKEFRTRGFEAPDFGDAEDSQASVAAPEGFACAGTFVLNEQAGFALQLLETAGISAQLVMPETVGVESDEAEDDAADDASPTSEIGLWVPEAEFDKACEILEANIDEILAQAESAGPAQ
jgi:hypothetical protein